MGRVDEEHVTCASLGGGQDRLQFGLEKSGLVCNVLGQVFFGGTGIARTRLNFKGGNPVSCSP